MNTEVARHILEELFLTHPEITHGIEFDGKMQNRMHPNDLY
jgi:hypothetical protein